MTFFNRSFSTFSLKTLSLTTLAVLLSGLAAQAKPVTPVVTTSLKPTQASSNSTASSAIAAPVSSEVTATSAIAGATQAVAASSTNRVQPIAQAPQVEPIAQTPRALINAPSQVNQLAQPTGETVVPAQAVVSNQTVVPGQTAAPTTPTPGSSVTSANSLQPEAANTQTTETSLQPPVQPTSVAQTPVIAQDVTPGRATRSGSSYFGVGGNIGLGSGGTALGDGSFAVFSKIGLTRNFSVRPGLLFSNDVTILLPVTYDFAFGAGPTGGLGFSAAPYLGIGPAISTGDGGSVDLLLTGGVDIPLTSQFTATAAVNATVTGDAAVGLLLGVGYNFSGF